MWSTYSATSSSERFPQDHPVVNGTLLNSVQKNSSVHQLVEISYLNSCCRFMGHPFIMYAHAGS